MMGESDRNSQVDLISSEEPHPNFSLNPDLLEKQLMKMPKLALVTSKFFLSLSKFCLIYYDNYLKEVRAEQLEKENTHSKVHHHLKKSEDSKDSNSESNKELSKTKIYPPNKKPLTAYILYYRERIPVFSSKYPTCTTSELTRLIAQEWKEIKESEKQPYLKIAAEDRKRYDAEKQIMRNEILSSKLEKEKENGTHRSKVAQKKVKKSKKEKQHKQESKSEEEGI